MRQLNGISVAIFERLGTPNHWRPSALAGWTVRGPAGRRGREPSDGGNRGDFRRPKLGHGRLRDGVVLAADADG
jgi:hypothetical protein